MTILAEQILTTLFDSKRTPRNWKASEIDRNAVKQAFDHAQLGPTSANCSPLRIVFVESLASKEKLKPCLSPGNIEQTMIAPITALFAYDLEFYKHMDKLYPHTNARAWFEGNDAVIQETAFRNSTLQAAYFMMAMRALGFDCGPMSGFDAPMVNEVFFKETSFRINFICNLGHGETGTLSPRDWRFGFEDICKII